MTPELERILLFGSPAPPLVDGTEIRRETVWVTMRDGVRLATDLHMPPVTPAPAIVMRTPYGRGEPGLASAFLSFARRGYVVVSQDCRGTGDSEPEAWDYYVYEPEDSFDLVDWVVRQPWSDGFLGAVGGSYRGQTQWCMSVHPRMSAIAPEVSGLGVAVNTTRLYQNLNAYARSVGKGRDRTGIPMAQLEREMREETLAGGYFNEPLYAPFPEGLLARYPKLGRLGPAEGRRWLWERYATLPPAQRAGLIAAAAGVERVTVTVIESLPSIFGHRVSHDTHTLPFARRSELLRSLHAPALMVTGWYDWGLNDALATWDMLTREGPEPVRSRSRLVITPSAHNLPGYHEGSDHHPELERTYRTGQIAELLLSWHDAVRADAVADWPRVFYYLMGANEWRSASAWPPPDARPLVLYCGPGGSLTTAAPGEAVASDTYMYDPGDPTPTVGGSIVSTLYRPGSADLSAVHRRDDVLTYTTAPLEHDLDIVGPLRLVLHASSTAVDTDFGGRISDVLPDGCAIQIQGGMLRARYRDERGEPELLMPGQTYRFEIDLWATAHRFVAGHQLRLDISSADFPRFDRNANRGGEPGPPVTARQTVHRDRERPSLLILSVLGRVDATGGRAT